mgnify:CR=1 FL=1
MFIQLIHFVQYQSETANLSSQNLYSDTGYASVVKKRPLQKGRPSVSLLFFLYGSVKNDQCHEHKICVACICKTMSFSIRCDGDVAGLYRAFHTVIVVLAFTT